MSVSVVIPTFNRLRSLQDVLNGLRRQTMRPFEVVIVDGPSTDGTAEYVASLGDAVRSARNPERNLSVSRNLGIAAAAGEIVAFLDDDAVPEPSWLEQLTAAFDDDAVGGAGGLVLDHTGVHVQWRHLVVSRAGEHDFEPRPPLDRYVARGADPFLYVAGGNCAFRRSALVDVEGFDEEIEYNFDEAEVCLRLLDRGWVLRSLEGAVVHHGNLPSHQRTAAASTDPFYAIKNRVYFAMRNAGRVHAPALASAGRELGQLRVVARIAAREGRLTPAGLDHHLGRADAGFHVGLQRGLRGRRRGRRLGPATGALRPFPVLSPSPRRRVALVAPAAGAAERLAAQGHDVHALRPVDGREPYRIDYEQGVWVHHVPIAARWLPELAGTPLREPLERAAALRAALDRVRAAEPVEVDGGPEDWFLHAGAEEVAAVLVDGGLDRDTATVVAVRLLEPHRFPADHELELRESLGEPNDGRFIDRVYEALLERRPEPFGRMSAVNELRAGLRRRDLVERIARSNEARGRGVDPRFVARLPAQSLPWAAAELRAAWLQDDEAFARRAHAALLGDETGAAADARRLGDGLDRHALVAELTRRGEAATRIPGAAHLPPADVRTAAELRSDLERIAWTRGTEFVDAAYRLVLDRPADPAGAREASELAARSGRAAVIRTLALSTEAAARGITAPAVEAALRRSPRFRLSAQVRRVSARARRR